MEANEADEENRGISVLFHVGQTFMSENEALIFFQNYAKNEGFTLVRGKVTRRADHSISGRLLKCSCYDQPSSKYRSTIKTNCGFHAWVRHSKQTNLWSITSLDVTHNHPLLSKDQIALAAQNRFFPAQISNRIFTLSEAGLNVSSIEAVLKIEFANTERTWIRTDIYQLLARDARPRKTIPQAVELMEAFNEISSKDKNFFNNTLVVDNVLMAVFWASGQQIDNLHKFGDVVLFDPTYKTNSLDMPFASFVGINNHGKSTVFACCLISDETIESFEWVFKQFKSICKETPPVIFTDEDQGMTIALQNIFPDSCHRLCIWHMNRNMIKNLGGILGSHLSDFLKDFNGLAYKKTDEKEFESLWEEMVKKYCEAINKESIGYLDHTYSTRKRWARTFYSGLFDGGMNSTQRAESFNASLKRLVCNRTRLSDLMKVAVLETEQTEKEKRLLEEVKHIRNGSAIPSIAATPLVTSLAKRLTPYAFGLVKGELEKSVNYCSTEDGLVSFRQKPEKQRRVSFLTSCECMFPSRMGLPCKHILNYSQRVQAQDLPEQGVADRWLHEQPCNVHIQVAFNVLEREFEAQAAALPYSEQERYIYLQSAFKAISAKYSSTKFEELKSWTAAMLSERIVDGIPLPLLSAAASTTECTLDSMSNLRDPPRPQRRGRKKRKVSTLDKERRKCGICKSLGHNARTCMQTTR